MAKRGASGPTGNKRERERSQKRKREEKENRKLERRELKEMGISLGDDDDAPASGDRPAVQDEFIPSTACDNPHYSARQAAGQREREEPKTASRRLFVGNLPYQCSEEDLKAAFSEEGRNVVGVVIPIDRDTGQPRGFAFVEMADEADARAAITAMDSAEIGGRRIQVNEARERGSR